MEKYTDYLLVLLLVSATFVGYVRLADPGMDSPTPEVQQDAEPHEQAATALRKLSAIDSKITVTERRNGTEHERSIILISPDQSAIRTKRVTGPPYEIYYTDGGMWTRFEEGQSWNYRSNVGYYPEANPFNPSPIRTTSPDRVVREGSTVILNYTETTPHSFFVSEFVNYYSPGMVGMQIHLNRSSKRVTRIDVQLESGEVEATLSYEFEYGDIDVERPSGVPRIALRPLIKDFLNTYRNIEHPYGTLLAPFDETPSL